MDLDPTPNRQSRPPLQLHVHSGGAKAPAAAAGGLTLADAGDTTLAKVQPVQAFAANAAAPTVGTDGVTLADMPDGMTKLEQLKWRKAHA